MHRSFCGWYFKCQSAEQTLAVIPAQHGKTRSVQMLCDDGVWTFLEIPGNCGFSPEGFCLNLHENGVSAVGGVSFGKLSPLRYDIMGPFQYVPFLQCRHSIVSMCHRVDGEICINGKRFAFDNALGYIEGDRGRSFPREYAWTQTFFPEGSLMISAADVPLAGRHFTGVIGIIQKNGREVRLATYLGARAVKTEENELVIRQGRFVFSARLLGKAVHPLAAPMNGSMVRTIHESAACRAAYRLEENGKTLLDFETDRASFEFEFGGDK